MLLLPCSSYRSALGEVMGSILGPNCVMAKDVNSWTYCWYMMCTTIIAWIINVLAKNMCNSLSYTSRQRLCNQGMLTCNSWHVRAFGPNKRSVWTYCPFPWEKKPIKKHTVKICLLILIYLNDKNNKILNTL